MAKLCHKIIIDTAKDNEHKIDSVKLSHFLETNNLNGHIFGENLENKKPKTDFINLYKCINKWKRTRNEDSLAKIGMSNMENSTSKSMPAKPNIITAFGIRWPMSATKTWKQTPSKRLEPMNSGILCTALTKAQCTHSTICAPSNCTRITP